jgi:biotin operon repressor
MLSVTGRDVDESEHAPRFTPENGAWTLLDGPAQDYAMSGNRAAVMRHLREHPGSTPKAIAEALGISRDTVKKTCQRMSADGQLTADTGGRYRAVDEPGTTAPESVPGVPGVPGVPEHLPNWENQPEFRGRPAGADVPGVPARLVDESDGPEDRLSRGESVPDGPGTCAACGHLTLWHGDHGQYRNKPCRKCRCAAFTTRSEKSANEEPQ